MSLLDGVAARFRGQGWAIGVVHDGLLLLESVNELPLRRQRWLHVFLALLSVSLRGWYPFISLSSILGASCWALWVPWVLGKVSLLLSLFVDAGVRVEDNRRAPKSVAGAVIALYLCHWSISIALLHIGAPVSGWIVSWVVDFWSSICHLVFFRDDLGVELPCWCFLGRFIWADKAAKAHLAWVVCQVPASCLALHRTFGLAASTSSIRGRCPLLLLHHTGATSPWCLCVMYTWWFWSLFSLR